MADDPRKEAAIRALARRLDAAMAEEAREYTPPVLEPLPDDPSIPESTRIKHDRARTQEFAGRLMRDAPVPEVTLQDRAELLAEQRARYEALPAGHPIKANLKRVMDDDALADYEAKVAEGTFEKVVIPDPDDAPPVVRTIPKDPNAYKALLEMFGATGLMGREKK
jgi:hypothetical protein